MSVLQQLLGELNAKYKTTGAPYYTGPGGLFGVPGLERDVISTRVQPISFASKLPAVGTVMTNPQFPYITGPTNEIGAEAETACGPCAEAGHMKSCIQTAQFGRYCRETRELEINRIGQQINRGEFQDIRVINDPILEDLKTITPSVSGNPSLFREVLMRFLEVGVSFQNLLGVQFYEGNPANSTGEGYKEFPGMNILIGVNKVDAQTGVPCPSLNSLIRDFGNQVITDPIDYYAEHTNPNIVLELTYMMRYLKHLAESNRLNPVDWRIVMREALYYDLTSVWPCAYLTSRCEPLYGNDLQFVNAADQIRLRDEMRNGQYLLIDGIKYPVEFDSFIEETEIQPGVFSSSIYIFPMTVMGGYLSTYWEYLDYSKGAMVGAEDGNYAIGDFWTDGGKYLWHKEPPTKWCIKFSAKIEPRVILRTPQLAARLMNVGYEPLIHTRDAHPDNPYFVDGGVAEPRPGPSLYSDWS